MTTWASHNTHYLSNVLKLPHGAQLYVSGSASTVEPGAPLMRGGVIGIGDRVVDYGLVTGTDAEDVQRRLLLTARTVCADILAALDAQIAVATDETMRIQPARE